jgi:hypothetical protein
VRYICLKAEQKARALAECEAKPTDLSKATCWLKPPWSPALVATATFTSSMWMHTLTISSLAVRMDYAANEPACAFDAARPPTCHTSPTVSCANTAQILPCWPLPPIQYLEASLLGVLITNSLLIASYVAYNVPTGGVLLSDMCKMISCEGARVTGRLQGRVPANKMVILVLSRSAPAVQL